MTVLKNVRSRWTSCRAGTGTVYIDPAPIRPKPAQQGIERFEAFPLDAAVSDDQSPLHDRSSVSNFVSLFPKKKGVWFGTTPPFAIFRFDARAPP